MVYLEFVQGFGEDTFAVFEIQTWLPDFIMGIGPFGIFVAWPIGEEIRGYR